MKRSVYILFVAAAGLIGAVLRGMSIVGGMDPETGLAVSTGPGLALIVLCIASLVIAVLLSRRCFGGMKTDYEALLGHISPKARLLCMICGAALAVTGAAALLNTGAMVAEQTSEYQPFGLVPLAAMIAQWILCIASGVTMALFARKQDGHAATARQGILIAVPMFWASLTLIMTYHENSSNPVMMDYAYELLMVIALLAAFYYIAGLFFADCKPVRVALFAGLAVILVLTCVGGLLIASVVNGLAASWTLTAPVSDLLRMAAYVFAGVYLLAELTQLGQKQG